MSGAVNAHTHLYSALAPMILPGGLEPAPRSFLEILERWWWRLDLALDEASLGASARWYIAGAIDRGTAALVDHHESPNAIEGSLDVLADACEELGMAAVLCYGASERNGGRGEAERGLAECRRFLRTNRRAAIRGAVGLHASFTVSDETIRNAARLCREHGAVLHAHVAEDACDVADANRRGYAGPLERLEALGALVPGSILAHGVHLGPDQVRRAADLGCWIVQNPRSNRHNGVGYPAALRHCDRTALGTDGFPSDMAEELAFLQRMREETGEEPARLSARLEGSRRLAAELGLAVEGAAPAPLEAARRAQIRDEAAEQARRVKARLSAA